jgi:RNA polymerase sigma factor (sigma-70 family)
MAEQELIPHLFRTEFGRISSVLSKMFGTEHIGVAEDIASDTFIAALESWPYKGVPPNPTAWLYAVAKNKAKNYIHRNELFAKKIAPRLYDATETGFDIDLSEQNILDSQLQMLFTICNPSIAPESQIGIALRILCGFGIDEIATAFLTSKDTINKRLMRAKKKLRDEGLRIEFPPPDSINDRLDSVLAAVYLMYSEGY